MNRQLLAKIIEEIWIPLLLWQILNQGQYYKISWHHGFVAMGKFSRSLRTFLMFLTNQYIKIIVFLKKPDVINTLSNFQN